MSLLRNKTGFTLVEVLITVAILGMIMLGLYRIMGVALSAQENVTGRGELLAQGRYAMERMAMFVQETDSITSPQSATGEEILKVSERLLDTYDNATHAYAADGDGIPDADGDADGLVNLGGADPPEWITFGLDKTDGGNWKLMEEMPDYRTGPPVSMLSTKVVCEHVQVYTCKRLSANLVEIQLTLDDGKSTVELKTRAAARWIP